MKIVLSGGGTGGHITPILAVAHELKRLDPSCEIIYIGERRGKFQELTQTHDSIDKIYTIFAGKFRRYHGESFLRKTLDIKTNLLNLRDFIYFCMGTIQSLFLLRKIGPDGVFLKGGFVGVPVGLASVFWRYPFITHDSDALPGLANRIVGRWARIHATGLPPEMYHYPPGKTRYVGVLVTSDYMPVDTEQQRRFKKELAIPEQSRVLFITGGSLGSRNINQAVKQIMPELLEKMPDLFVVHQVGKGADGLYGSFRSDRLQVLPFLRGMHRYSGAADVIVTRAGANTMAEFGIQNKACIVIPNPLLAGGHQLKNAQYLDEHNAAIVLQEDSLSGDTGLRQTIAALLDDEAKRNELAQKLHNLVRPNAAQDLASLLLEITSGRKDV